MTVLPESGKRNVEIITPYLSDRPSRDGETNVIGMRDIAQILRRRSGMFGLITFVGTSLAALAAYALPDSYTAQATLVLEDKDTRLSEAVSEFESISLTRMAVETEVAVFRTRDFVRTIVDDLNLLQDPLFNSDLRRERSSPDSAGSALEKLELESPEDTTHLPDQSEQREKTISVLLSKVAVDQGGESRAITIAVTHADPRKAARIANAMVDKYVQLSLERKKQATNRAIEFLHQRARKLGVDVAGLERKLADHIWTHQLDDKTLDSRLYADIKNLKTQLQLLRNPRHASSGLTSDKTRAETVEVQLADLEKRLQERTRAEVRRLQLEREVLTETNRHNQVVERLANLDSAIEVLNPSARVVSRASPPIKPSYPHRAFIVGGGLAGSVILGIMMSIMLESLDSRIHSEEQLTAITGLPNLGVIPFESFSSTFGRRPVHICMTNRPHSYFAEELRSFCFTLLRMGSSGTRKIIMLTSCWPGEGKSALSVALAVTAATNGLRPVLLDLDMRTRGASKSLMLPDVGVGVESYLSGACSLDDAVQKDVGVEGLDVIPSVAQKDSPVALLNSKRMAVMLDDLRGKYDIIILDTPPVMLVNDPNMPGPLVDAVVLVVRISQTQASAVKTAVKRLGLHRVPLIGTVLNGEASLHRKYRNKYYKKYQYAS